MACLLRARLIFQTMALINLALLLLIQGLADGYFILPQTIANYLAINKFNKIESNHEKVQQALNAAKVRIEQLMNAPEAETLP